MKAVSFFHWLTLVAAVLILTSCGSFLAGSHRGPVDQESVQQAEKLLKNVLNVQGAPSTFKGIGKVRIEKDSQLQFGRMAWVGSLPDKLRIQLLGLAGQSVASLSSDGKNLYIMDHQQRRFFQKKLSGASLKQVLSIPVPTKDIVAILAGRTPVIDFTFATVDQKMDSDPVLILEKGFWADYEKIYFDDQKKRACAAEFYSSDGDLKYRVVFERMRWLKGSQVPDRIVLTDGCNTEIVLDVDRYWVDVNILPSAFILTPPEMKSKNSKYRTR